MGLTSGNRQSVSGHILAMFIVIFLLGACTTATDSGPEQSDSTARPGAGDKILPMTLTNWMFAPQDSPATEEPVGLAHLSVTPLEPGANSFEIELTTLEGAALPQAAPPAEVSLTVQQLDPDAPSLTPPLTRTDDGDATWSTDDVDLPEQGWYELTVTLESSDTAFGTATTYALLPDPSVYGSESVELPETDPDAQALFDLALQRYAGWDAVRWRESLGSGADVLVVTDFTLTNRSGEPPAFMTETRYTGAFRPRSDDSPPADPRFDYSDSITIEDSAWRRRDSPGWEEVPTVGVSTQSDREEIFTGATGIQLAGTHQVDGRELQVITFYLPPDGGQSEAWFAWWIDPETGDPVRMAMVAYMHFMIWEFFDIDGSFTIAPPQGIGTATPAP